MADAIVPEPLGGAHRDRKATLDAVRDALRVHLTQLCALSPDAVRGARYDRFRALGVISQ